MQATGLHPELGISIVFSSAPEWLTGVSGRSALPKPVLGQTGSSQGWASYACGLWAGTVILAVDGAPVQGAALPTPTPP